MSILKDANLQKRRLSIMNNFSVAMCVYRNDNPNHFIEAFNSIIEQTVPPNEIVLVIDGPITEGLESAVSLFKESFSELKIIRFNDNKGHGEARRKSFEVCTNDLVAIMDADDICVKDRFEKQLKVFESSNVDVVGGQIIEFIDNPKNIIGERRVPLTDEAIKKYAKRRCPMNQVTIMIKKDSYIDAGGYLDWYQEEDYYLWIRMMLKEKIFVNLEDILVEVRVGKEMYSRRGGVKYFRSEKRLQKFLLKNKIIGFCRYVINVAERFVVQVLMTNKMRKRFFKYIRSN